MVAPTKSRLSFGRAPDLLCLHRCCEVRPLRVSPSYDEAQPWQSSSPLDLDTLVHPPRNCLNGRTHAGGIRTGRCIGCGDGGDLHSARSGASAERPGRGAESGAVLRRAHDARLHRVGRAGAVFARCRARRLRSRRSACGCCHRGLVTDRDAIFLWLQRRNGLARLRGRRCVAIGIGQPRLRRHGILQLGGVLTGDR